ncbi:hypothetical protein COO60DRAFT_774882 [Scenedesmus sp. NREL 46B-D3]|nr:hypothetical protein COO60DRAFT_774882 [Scenedesmus sp. NREL 46B-D3]
MQLFCVKMHSHVFLLTPIALHALPSHANSCGFIQSHQLQLVRARCRAAVRSSHSQLGSGFVAVGNVLVGTSKAQLDEAAKTVFWRSNRDAGLKLGQAKCNFRTMRRRWRSREWWCQCPRTGLQRLLTNLALPSASDVLHVCEMNSNPSSWVYVDGMQVLRTVHGSIMLL